MQLTILTVGRLKERYWLEAQQEYLKRLSPFARIKLVEVADESAPEGASPALEEKIKNLEGMRISKHIPQDNYVIALDRLGRTMNSREFAAAFAELGLQGKSQVTLIIGGSLGLAESILKSADLRLSFSQLTFPHQLMRVILLEQIYRLFKINRGEPYHK
ncbi:MAG: 23S rRNA (pseudouridine(1915)-N(3))-methyltransferase RlmH [Peptococcaceae bacterium]|nr:23S rRNA (pseudouridine(1915)-N(3))-methyltransferase RlmH [Peptococcaceae bacterium]